MKIPEKFKNFFWGENKIFFPEEEFVIKLSYPRVFVRYTVSESFVDYETFKHNVVEIQYLDGERPGEKEQEEIIIDIWNYIGIEERLLEDDLKDVETNIKNDIDNL